MGQASSNKIDELNDLTLNGVVPQNVELGRGAYGVVYTVKHDGIVCAAKRIHSILTDNVSPREKQERKDNFVRECLYGSSIDHPNIVKFLGVYYPSSRCSLPDMVFELMATSLTVFVGSNKSMMAFETKLSILYDVSVGLSYLHNRQPVILHRDLSSNNIMLTDKLVAKIGDLGVAKIIRADSKQTRSKLTGNPGTLHFMPPEASIEEPVYSTPIDVFSFGCVALHVLSEEWPKPSVQKIRDPITKRLVALSEVERRQQYLDKITGNATVLKQMVRRCLDDDPDGRPSIQVVSSIIEPLKVRVYIHLSCVTTYSMVLSRHKLMFICKENYHYYTFECFLCYL